LSISIEEPDVRKECENCSSKEDIKSILIKKEMFRVSYSRSTFLCKTCRLELAKKILGVVSCESQ